MNTAVVVCMASLGALLFALGANVTRLRITRGSGNQAPDDPSDPLLIAIRAHGNAAEYIPTLIVLLLICTLLIDAWWVEALAGAAVVARYAHAIGMLRSASLATRALSREAGAVGTYLTGMALAVTAVAAVTIA